MKLGQTANQERKVEQEGLVEDKRDVSDNDKVSNIDSKNCDKNNGDT